MAFENPMYGTAKASHAANTQPLYDNKDGNEGLYDEPAFASKTQKSNPIFSDDGNQTATDDFTQVIGVLNKQSDVDTYDEPAGIMLSSSEENHNLYGDQDIHALQGGYLDIAPIPDQADSDNQLLYDNNSGLDEPRAAPVINAMQQPTYDNNDEFGFQEDDTAKQSQPAIYDAVDETAVRQGRLPAPQLVAQQQVEYDSVFEGTDASPPTQFGTLQAPPNHIPMAPHQSVYTESEQQPMYEDVAEATLSRRVTFNSVPDHIPSVPEAETPSHRASNEDLYSQVDKSRSYAAIQPSMFEQPQYDQVELQQEQDGHPQEFACEEPAMTESAEQPVYQNTNVNTEEQATYQNTDEAVRVEEEPSYDF